MRQGSESFWASSKATQGHTDVGLTEAPNHGRARGGVRRAEAIQLGLQSGTPGAHGLVRFQTRGPPSGRCDL